MSGNPGVDQAIHFWGPVNLALAMGEKIVDVIKPLPPPDPPKAPTNIFCSPSKDRVGPRGLLAFLAACERVVPIFYPLSGFNCIYYDKLLTSVLIAHYLV